MLPSTPAEEELFTGLDLGATNVKGALVDDEGRDLVTLGRAWRTERIGLAPISSRTLARVDRGAACATGPPSGKPSSSGRAREGLRDGLGRRDARTSSAARNLPVKLAGSIVEPPMMAIGA